MSWSGADVSDKAWQAVEKRTSAALHSFLTIACKQVSGTASALHLRVFEQPE